MRFLPWWFAGLLLGAGCGPDEAGGPGGELDSDAGEGRDGGEDEVDGEALDPDPGPDKDAGKPAHCGFATGKLDLLLVVDNSGSMRAEQDLLARELPHMAAALASGDVNGDGMQDHPKADLHVGVISTDMGLSGLRESTVCSLLGDDGLLRLRSECTPAPSGYLTYEPDTDDSVAGLGQSLDCQVRLGTEGCGLEQQLEATLKALTPGTSGLQFAFGSPGHGDGPNAGFLRDDSILAIVQVTDEDDCSFPETSVGFTLAKGPYEAIGLNYRCHAMPELLYPIGRYTETLAGLRPGVVGGVFFALIAGIPTAAELGTGPRSIDEILALPQMAFAPDGELTFAGAKPACRATRTDAQGHPLEEVQATPARRLLEVAKAFGDHAVVASICEETFQLPIEAIAKRIGGVLACPEDPIIF